VLKYILVAYLFQLTLLAIGEFLKLLVSFVLETVFSDLIRFIVRILARVVEV